MRYLYQALCLMLLLVMAQQGALVHEVGHFRASDSSLGGLERTAAGNAPAGLTRLTGLDVDAAADGGCSLCPGFTQVVSAAFSYSLQLPALGRVESERSPEPRHAPPGAVEFTPRSRGPPARS